MNAIPENAWPDWVIGAHDKHRIASKIGQSQARVLAMLVLTLKGTPFFFAGDEIGMEQVAIPPECIRDPFEKLVGGYGLNRDPERVPMRWNEGRNGGFTSGDPWLPMGHDVAERNVEKLKADPRSLLWLYRRLISLRRSEPRLAAGDYLPLRNRHGLLVYKRVCAGNEILIALNTVHEPRKLESPSAGTVLLSTYVDRDGEIVDQSTVLRPDEGVILKLRT